jgi:hypothetical protein
MSNESESIINRKELTQLIEATVNSALYPQQSTRIVAIKETSIMHYFNLGAKSKAFLKSTADLSLAIVDSGLSLTTAFIKSEVVRPSLDSDTIARWLWEEAPNDKTIIVTDNK